MESYYKVICLTIIGTLILVGMILFYGYKINSKYIENGYQRVMVVGGNVPLWQKE